MHDAVYWLAADPYDLHPEVWRPYLVKYAWVCQTNGRVAPKDLAGLEQYVADYNMVDSLKHCNMVSRHWQRPHMRDAATRTTIDTNSGEWVAG